MKHARFLALALLLMIAGCGQRRERTAPELTFELQADTAGLAAGTPVLGKLDAYRATDGAVRVRGDADLPDGVRMQISVYRHGTNELAGRVQFETVNHHFDTPPIGSSAPLPHGAYRLEYLALFNPAWQTEDILRRTNGGRALRGPGVTRDRVGGPAIYLVEERRL